MYRGKWSLVFVMFLITYWLKDVGAAEMTLEMLQQMYKNSTSGYQICYFDGSFCARGQEYCDVKEGTCKSLFPKDASEETKLATCKEVIQRNETRPGVYDTCVYFFGELESRRVLRNHTECHPQDTHPMRAPGKELCRYPDISCQLGYEFCNITGGNCEPLFPHNASDTEKRQRCEQVISNNMTMLRDACIYALGNMRYSESLGNHTEDHPQDTNRMRAPGKELCRHPDIFCELGYEFCNITGGNCEPLFPHNASDTEKRQRCEQVISNNMTMLRDTCSYALGNMRCSGFNVTDKKAAEQATHNNVWGITMTVLFVIAALLITMSIAFFFIIKYKKRMCFKETPALPVQLEHRNAPVKDDGDINVPEESRLYAFGQE